jgi:hypothetical protein
MVIVTFLCWLMAPVLFGLMTILTAIIIAFAYSKYPSGVPRKWKIGMIVGYLAIDCAILLLTPGWLGAMAFSTTIVFLVLLANEPAALPRLAKILILIGILVLDVVVFAAPAEYRLTTLTLAMPIVTVLSVVALLAYPRSYRSLPSDKWQ